MIRLLGKDKPIPYDLLLLADETIASIDKYIHQSDIYVLEQDQAMIAVFAHAGATPKHRGVICALPGRATIFSFIKYKTGHRTV